MSRYKKLISDTVLMTVGNFSSKVLIFVLLPFYTYVLTTEEYGVADLFTTTVSMLVPVLTLSISESTFRFAFDKEVHQDKNIFCSILIIILSGIMLLPITSVLSIWNSSFGQYCIYFVLLYFTNAVHTCFVNYARGTDQIRVFVTSNILHTILLITFNIVFLTVIKIGLKGYLTSMILAFAGSVIYIFIRLQCWKAIDRKNFEIALCKEMLKFSVPMIFSTAAWWLMNSISKYMIIEIYGIDVSGVYGVAQKIPTILTVLSSIFVQAWQISAINARQDKDSDMFYTNVYKAYEVGLYCITAGIVFLTKPLATILFQKDYYSAFVYVPILLLSGVFSCLASFLQSPFMAEKRSGLLLQSTFAGALINVILNYYFLKKMGPIGAAYATTIGFGFTWLIRVITSRKFVTIKIEWCKTIVSIFLLLAQASFVSMEIPYATVYSGGIACVIVALHFNTMRIFAKNIFGAVNRTRIK